MACGEKRESAEKGNVNGGVRRENGKTEIIWEYSCRKGL
jgi:hypothetical protein